MTNLDLKLDPNTHDLVFENYNLSFTDPKYAVAQRIKIRMMLFLGEWFLDTSKGIPYFDQFFVKSPDLNLIEALLKEQILTVEDVTELQEFNLNFDEQLRSLSVDFKVNTTFGELVLSEQIIN